MTSIANEPAAAAASQPQKSKIVALISIACVWAGTSCVGGSSETPAEDKDRLKPYILASAPPNIPNKLNINYDGKATLLGYAIDPIGSVSPGQRVKLTLYWRSDKKLEDGWNLFTHVLDGSGERVLNIDNVGPLREWRDSRQVLWPSAWEPGKFYVDEQVFTVPGVKTEKIQVVTGIWRDSTRLKTLSGPHDKENRGIVVTIATSVQRSDVQSSTRVPSLRVDKLDKSIKVKIDGNLDEPAWSTAPTAGPFVDVSSGQANPGHLIGGQVKLLWNVEGLLVGFDVKDPDVRGGFKKEAKDPHLWTKDTVEIMVDPDGDGDNRDYYEIQINPQNLVFDSQFDAYNHPKKEPDGPFGHQDWSAKLKSAVKVNGTIDDSSDKDIGYTVEAMIPWKSFSKAKASPPAVGDTWRMNFYAMQDNGGVGWSAILGQGNFHKASRFGRVLWAEPGYVSGKLGALGGDAGGAGDAASLPSGLSSTGNAAALHGDGAAVLDSRKLPRIRVPVTGGPTQHVMPRLPPAPSAAP